MGIGATVAVLELSGGLLKGLLSVTAPSLTVRFAGCGFVKALMVRRILPGGEPPSSLPAVFGLGVGDSPLGYWR